MTGYVRQSAADIVPTGVVRAAPINNELNALRDAFATAGGHKHDGTAAEGHPVPVIGDSDLLNKIATDTGNNRHGVFVEVGGAAVEQVRFQDGAIVPVTDNDVDLGTSALEFKDLHIDGTANIDSLVADTADINGGTVDGAVIGGSSAAAGSFTTLAASGVVTSTVSTGTAPLVIASTTKVANLNVDQLDGADWAAPAAIGTSTPAAGTFTSLTANSSLVAATADINGGTVDGAVIGASSAQAITGTTVTATTGFVGGLTGAVTGNVTGNLTGNVTGDVTGNLTGNVTASSGSSTFNDVVINGGLNMNAGTSATITNLTSPTNTNDAATKGYVDTSIANLIDSAPGALDTLNELAAALGDDASFSTTVTNSIATKLALAGGTMSGAIAMGTNKITGLGNPTANQDAATKTYVDTADALNLPKAGGTMSGAIAMGTNKITGLGTPTDNADATTKLYVDGILGSATSAAASAAAAAVSASNAATSESNASTSASNASTSASNAATSATNAAASYDAFDDRYLGSKTSAPSVDNDGNALLTGALYWNSTSSELYLWTGSAWTRSALTGSDYVAKSGDTMTGALTTTALTLSGGTANGVAYLNGSKVLTSGSLFAYDGTSASIGDSLSGADGSKLYIYGNVPTSTQLGIKIGGNATTYAQQAIRFYDTYSEQYAGYIGFTPTSLTFGQGTTEGMRLTSTGLGIGTSSPGYKLDVNGTFGLGTGQTGNIGVFGANTATGDTYFKLRNTAGAFDIGTSATGHYFYGQGSLPLQFFTNATERMRLDSAGNLGLGVTPSAWSGLGVAFETLGGALAGEGTNNLSLYQNVYYQSSAYRYKTTGNAASIYSQSNGAHRWFTAPVGTAGNAISFTQAMTLDASGNLLVADTTPAFSFSGRGNITIGGTTGSLLGFRVSSVNKGYIYHDGTSLDINNQANGFMSFSTNATERARIDSSGNLGLGVTPSAWSATWKAFQTTGGSVVGSTSNIRMAQNWYHDGTSRYVATRPASMFVADDGTFAWYTAPSGTAGSAISFTQAMTLDASGNLGVGTTSPSYPLHVNATGNGTKARFTNGTTTLDLYCGGTEVYTGTAGSSTSWAYATANTYIAGYVNGTERMRLDSSGNLLVGGSAARGTTVGTAHLDLFNGTAPAGTLTNGISLYSSSGDLKFMDSAGNAYSVGFRNVPQSGSSKTTSYTLATTDVGEYILLGASGAIVIPDATFSTGDVVTIFNNTSSTATLTCSITTAYIAGTYTDKATMTLAAAGVATVLFISGTLCVVSGNVT